ncbi:hypothetical protein [Acaryochloris marina]|uniref:hypothetical protein n=1 Tax=Acaryochloris marina TaxID=155978 RepID=UPI0021C345E1|nr:hypothetical protein [Acaryochloris marina]
MTSLTFSLGVEFACSVAELSNSPVPNPMASAPDAPAGFAYGCHAPELLIVGSSSPCSSLEKDKGYALLSNTGQSSLANDRGFYLFDEFLLSSFANHSNGAEALTPAEPTFFHF